MLATKIVTPLCLNASGGPMAKHPPLKISLASHVEHHSSRALNIDIRVLKTLIVSFTSRFLQLDWKRVNYSFGQMTMYLVSETYERDAEVVRVSNSEYGNSETKTGRRETIQ